MRGSKARKIRAAVYWDGYTRKVVYERKNGGIIATGLRREYQAAKKGSL